MKYLKLYEAFKSEILSDTFSFISTVTRDNFLEWLESICRKIDFPISELNDDYFKRMTFDEALELSVDPNHKVNTIKWIKFWFDREGNFLEVSAVDGSTIKKSNELTIDDFDIVEELNSLSKIKSLETGDVVYIKLESGRDPCVATVFRHVPDRYTDRESVYMVQNYHQGSSPDGTYEYAKYGEYCWVIETGGDYVGSPKLLKRKTLDSEQSTDFYSYNMVLLPSLALCRMRGELQPKIRKANFALVLDFDSLKSGEYKRKSEIKSERELAKKGSLAMMTDSQIKKEKLEKYLTDIVSKIKFEGDLTKIKDLIGKVCGGRHILSTIVRNKIVGLKDLILRLYSHIKITKQFERNPDDIYVQDSLKSSIYNIESIIKNSYTSLYRNQSEVETELELYKDELGKDLSRGRNRAMWNFINKFQKLNQDFYLLFREKNIETLEEAEILYYKMFSIFEFSIVTTRFEIICQFIQATDINVRKRILSNRFEDLEEATNSIEEYYRMIKNLLN